MNDVINRKDAIGAILGIKHIAELSDGDAVIRVSAANYVLGNLPSAQPDFDITVKIDKAYDDGYEAGYLQGRHDWGDWDE